MQPTQQGAWHTNDGTRKPRLEENMLSSRRTLLRVNQRFAMCMRNSFWAALSLSALALTISTAETETAAGVAAQ